MRTREDIEAYLGKYAAPFETIDESTFVVRVAKEQNVAIRIEDGQLIFRANLRDIGAESSAAKLALFQAALGFNATDLMHSAYGLSGNLLILVASQLLENVDYNEFAATLEDFALAHVQHKSVLENDSTTQVTQ